MSPGSALLARVSGTARWFVLALLLALLGVTNVRFIVGEEEGAKQPVAAEEFICRFAAQPPLIDGQAAEAAWQSAPVIERFTLPWRKDNPSARTATRARLLWDREHLYFFADMDDADLYADVKEHDGATWNNDVFELFLKPADDKPGYYEFQVSAAGTVMDMFLPRRNAGGYDRFRADGDFHIESKVVLRGTLNKWHDRDQGWSVEGRIPWNDLLRTGGRPEVNETWKFTLCRYDYSVDFEGPELSTCAPLKKPVPDFHAFEDYATVRFAGPEQIGRVVRPAEDAAGGPDRLTALRQALPTVKSHVVGSPEPPLPYRAKRVREEMKLTWPIFVALEPGSEKLLVIDQKASYGTARVARTKEGGDLETLVEYPEGGVAYSMALHPRFAENGYLFVGWNGAPDGGKKRCFVTRYTIDRAPPHGVIKDSALNVIEWESDGHNGAAIAFGTDGMLYVTSGDGTSDSDLNLAGQGLDHLLSKLLRIDVDHPAPGQGYSIPNDNPYVGPNRLLPGENVRPETWAYGFRNPWRLTIDPQTGHIWVGNNGQDLWEQVYLVERGANYGWSVYEGSHPFYPNRPQGPTPISKPAAEHPHSEARSLTGGVVYYGKQLPELYGAYLYGDYSTGKIWAAKVDQGKVVLHREVADTSLQITSFALDSAGELLISDHRGNGEGGLYTLEPNPPDDSAARFPRKLSATGLFTSVARHQVHPGLIPYSVNAPLWSDGAYKERYLYLPTTTNAAGEVELSRIDLGLDDRGWNLPEGTVVVKSFALDMKQGDPGSRRWVETRLLVKEQGEWVGYSYQWNHEQTDATLVASGGLDQTFEIDQGASLTKQTWHFPSRTECMVCHSRAANFMLGLSTPQMNKDHDFNGTVANQLEVLSWLGVLRVGAAEQKEVLWEALVDGGKSEQEASNEMAGRTASRDQRAFRPSTLMSRPLDHYQRMVDPYDRRFDLTARAKSYLHANCSQCHQEAGGGNAQLQLTWSTPVEEMGLLNELPLHHKFNLAQPRLVAPGQPVQSVLLHRMATRGPGQMPQLATSVVDEEAVSLIRDWIHSLQPSASDRAAEGDPEP
jgi:uncharacterized repeat protein (TIGR03806 family)